DRAVRLHRQLAPLAVGAVVVHVILLIPIVMEDGGSVGDLLIPFWSADAKTPESLDLIALLVWTGFAYARWWSYEGWLSLHTLIGPIFLIGTALSFLLEGTTVAAYEPLRFWMWFLLLVGLAAWIYRALLYRWVAPRFNYSAQSVSQLNDSTLD